MHHRGSSPHRRGELARDRMVDTKGWDKDMDGKHWLVVHLVMRENFDGLYGFTDEAQADAYAARFEGAERGTLRVLDFTAGAALLAKEDEDEDDEAYERLVNSTEHERRHAVDC